MIWPQLLCPVTWMPLVGGKGQVYQAPAPRTQRKAEAKPMHWEVQCFATHSGKAELNAQTSPGPGPHPGNRGR